MSKMPLTLANERALEACYGALAEPSRWEDALNLLAHSMGAGACQLLPHDYSEHPFAIVRSSGMWPWDELWCRNVDWVTDIYSPRGLPLARSGYRALIQEQLFTDDELRTSHFHNVIARPAGCFHWASSSFLVEDRIWCLPFFRNSAPFGQEDRKQLAEISVHMARIVSLAEKFARVGAEREVLALEKVGCAAMLVDRGGRIIGLNHLAESLVCSDFGICKGRLWTADSISAGRIRRFIADITLQVPRPLLPPAPIIVFRGGLPWLMIEAMPVTDSVRNVFQDSRAILVLNDLTHNGVTDTVRLCLAFGSTSAEARLAGMLLNGHDLQSSAKLLGVSHETVRSQLKSLFAKTGTHCQSQLLARVSRMRGFTQH